MEQKENTSANFAATYKLNNTEETYDPRSWHFDPQTKRAITLSGDKDFALVPATYQDFQKVLSFYEHHPVSGYGISQVEVIYNPGFNRGFALHLKKLQKRDQKSAFTPQWPHMVNAEQRQIVYGQFIDLTKPYGDLDYPAVKLLPAWHGTRPEVLESIFSTGYANLATTDAGFFGKGYYSAYEAEYSYRVYSKGALILNWVASFSPLPVVDDDMQVLELEGKNNYGNYDAHFVPVKPRDPTDPNETIYYPCKPNEKHQYTELVVFESAACLPRYLVTLEPTLLPSPKNNPSNQINTNNTSLTKYASLTYFFNIKGNTLNPIGQIVAEHLSERDMQSMACISRGHYRFFKGLREKVKEQKNLPSSKINPNLHFSETEYIVFLMNIVGTQHAFIVVESAKAMTRYDYSTSASTLQVVSQSFLDSTSRITPSLKNASSDNTLPGQVNIGTTDINQFAELVENAKLQYQEWVINADTQKKLHDLVYHDMMNPPDYGLQGSHAYLGSGKHNCLTWCIDKLKESGIPVNQHWTTYVLIAKPSTVNKPSICNIL